MNAKRLYDYNFYWFDINAVIMVKLRISLKFTWLQCCRPHIPVAMEKYTEYNGLGIKILFTFGADFWNFDFVCFNFGLF